MTRDASEMREIWLQEMLTEPDIPEIDEDAHLHDYDYDYVVYCAKEHESDEYRNLRSIGLTHTQAEKVISND